MPLSRSIETTVMGFDEYGRADAQPISFLFLPTEVPRHAGIEAILFELKIAPVEVQFNHDADPRLPLFGMTTFGRILLGAPTIKCRRKKLTNLFNHRFGEDATEREDATKSLRKMGRNALHRMPVHEGELYAFQQLWNEPAIVIESSPPDLASLATLVQHSSGAALGAVVGFAAAGSNPLLLFLTVPIGILVCGTATGVAKGLEAGLRERVHRLVSPIAKRSRHRAEPPVRG